MGRGKIGKAKCYCCNEISTSREHIPPECFFPGKEYLPDGSPDYKKNLLTLPSCKKHNTARAKDDEYTAIFLILNADSEIAFTIFKSKWFKTLEKNNLSIAKTVFSKSRLIQVQKKVGSLIIPYETAQVSYDRDRIDNVIQSIARGLYHYESKYQDKWLGDCTVQSPNFLMADLSLSPDYEYLMFESQVFENSELEKKGANPDIFIYQIWQNLDKVTIKMVFYKTIIFFVRFEAKSYKHGQGFEK